MTFMFIAALLTTFQSISGVQAKDFSIWEWYQSKFVKQGPVVYENKEHSSKKVSLGKKGLSRYVNASSRLCGDFK